MKRRSRHVGEPLLPSKRRKVHDLVISPMSGVDGLESLFVSVLDADGDLDMISAFGYFLACQPILDEAMRACGFTHPHSGIYHVAPSSVKLVSYLAALDVLEQCPATPRLSHGLSTISVIRRNKTIASLVLKERLDYLSNTPEAGMYALQHDFALRLDARSQMPLVRMSVAHLRAGMRDRAPGLTPLWFSYLPDILLFQSPVHPSPEQVLDSMNRLRGASTALLLWLVDRVETPEFLVSAWVLGAVLVGHAWNLIDYRALLQHYL